jgi:transporter family-2 protein
MASSNGMLGKSFGSPFTATLAVFIFASMLIGLIVILTNNPGLSISSISNTNWKMWLGGVIVVMNIITFTIVPQKIGASNMIVIFIAGQILSSVIVEHFGLLNFPVHTVNWYRVLGLTLIIFGVMFVKKN